MKFDFSNMQIRSLFAYKNKQLNIPRYQRDYSWERKQTKEFLVDILSAISLENNELTTGEYFFGTVLLAGDFNNSNRKLEVIDGQQRITTMTIFLSALAKTFSRAGKGKLGEKIWTSYIMKDDDNGEFFKVLKNDTTNDYFQYLIQMKQDTEKEPIDEEQECIKDAYFYFLESLTEGSIKKMLNKTHKNDLFDTLDYIKILCVIRDQLLSSNMVCISTNDKNSANLIFEILNAKGKKLASIDLIKNKIFNYLDIVEPTDDANNIWKQIKKNLISRNERVEFSTFYRHYWISKYKKVRDDQLYNDFVQKIEEKDYKKFLEELEKMSKLYVSIICPNNQDYENKKQHLYIVECLDYLNKYFNIKQIRVALLAIFDARFNSKTLSNKVFKKTINYLHGFHFAYNALCSKRSNALEAKYSKFAIDLNNASKNETNQIINKFISELDKIYPKYEEFEEKFIKLEFTKKNKQSNMLAKYVLNNIEKHKAKLEVSPQDGSIEHILPESVENEYKLNIGNLILLEDRINREAENLDFSQKMIKYDESKYSYVKELIAEYGDIEEWNEEIIIDRAKKMSKYFYHNILR